MVPLYSQEEFNSAKRTDLLPYQCIYCKKTFYKWKGAINDILNPNREETGNYCSQKCSNNHRFPPTFKPCETCGSPVKITQYKLKINKHIFCSRKCAGKYSSTHRKHGYKISKLELWLQEKLNQQFQNLEILYNQNNTINNELDIYIPTLRLAFELNGIFHYKPIYGKQCLENQKRIDLLKQEKCLNNGIKLIIIDTSSQTYFHEKTSHIYLKNIINAINETAAKVGFEPTEAVKPLLISNQTQ